MSKMNQMRNDEIFLHKPKNKHLNFQYFDTDTVFDSLSVSPTQTYSEQ